VLQAQLARGTRSSPRSRPRTRCSRRCSTRSAFAERAGQWQNDTLVDFRWPTTTSSREADAPKKNGALIGAGKAAKAAPIRPISRGPGPGRKSRHGAGAPLNHAKPVARRRPASTWLGQVFAWAIVALTLLISWEVFSRYVLNNPHAWVLDAQIMLYGTLFMMAGAYTLAKNGHVRGDVLYGFFNRALQATLDLILYIVFFLPGIVALVWAGWTYAAGILAIREQTFSADGPPIYPVQDVIPLPAACCCCRASSRSCAASCMPATAPGRRASRTWKKSTSRSSRKWCTSDEDIAALDKYVWRAGKRAPTGARNEDPQGTLVRLHPDGADHRRHGAICMPAASR
jgi:TRAP-type mannitol/chloroaromatic compound transport system permease small subunit